MGRLYPWSISLTRAIVDRSSALIRDVSVKSLDFTLSISSFSCSSKVYHCLGMCFYKWMPSQMIPTWSLAPSSLPSLPIETWIFNTSPINNYWSSCSCPNSCLFKMIPLFQPCYRVPFPAQWKFLRVLINQGNNLLLHLNPFTLRSFYPFMRQQMGLMSLCLQHLEILPHISHV